jgi:hypothetical protein
LMPGLAVFTASTGLAGFTAPVDISNLYCAGSK